MWICRQEDLVVFLLIPMDAGYFYTVTSLNDTRLTMILFIFTFHPLSSLLITFFYKEIISYLYYKKVIQFLLLSIAIAMLKLLSVMTC